MRLLLVRLLKGGNVEFFHFEKRLSHSRDLLLVFVLKRKTFPSGIGRPAGQRLTNVAGHSLKKCGESSVLAAWKTVRGGLVPINEPGRQGDYCDAVRNFGDSAESTLSFGALT